jgi:hypothetical protein
MKDRPKKISRGEAPFGLRLPVGSPYIEDTGERMSRVHYKNTSFANGSSVKRVAGTVVSVACGMLWYAYGMPLLAVGRSPVRT